MQLVQIEALALESVSDFENEPRVKNLRLLCVKMQNVDDANLENLAIDIASQLEGPEIDTVVACIERGPLADGDLPSKTGRDFLISLGLLSQVIVKGEDGFNAGNYYCLEVYKGLKAIEADPELAKPGEDGVLGNLAPDTEEA